MARKKKSAKSPARHSSNGHRLHQGKASNSSQRTYTIADYRLEKPSFTIHQTRANGEVCYEVEGDLGAPVPPIRESKYLDKKQSIEIYRWMLLNRRMETALENLYKQGKVVGGVYFGLGQEACSCASAHALHKDDWLGPMIRNQGSLLVRGFSPRDIMMQYMAKAGSPTNREHARAWAACCPPARSRVKCAWTPSSHPNSPCTNHFAWAVSRPHRPSR